jgi:hypothetical protein
MRLEQTEEQQMTTKTITALASMAAVVALCGPAYSQPVDGRPGIVFADPSDLVIGLVGINGPCGPALLPPLPPSNLFHAQRANINFREVVAVTLTAYAAGKFMTLFVTGCSGNRNIISHVAVHD